MAQFPCLPMWTDAWVADTKHLTRTERGTYFDLLVVMWRTPGCKVPNDNDWLAKHLGMTLAEVAAELRPIINEFCRTDGNWVYQKRLKHEFVRRFEYKQNQSVRAKHREYKKKVQHPNLDSGDATFPSPSTVETSFFPTAATPVDKSNPVAKKQQVNSAGSLATALPSGALPRQPKVSASLEEVIRAKGWKQ